MMNRLGGKKAVLVWQLLTRGGGDNNRFEQSEAVVINEAKDKKVLLLYQQRVQKNKSYDAVSAVRNLLAHFTTRIIELDIKDYQPGMIRFYDVVFYLATEKDKLTPQSFYNDVVEEKDKTVCWIYEGVLPLIEKVEDSLGFSVGPKEYGFGSVTYRGYSFNREGEDVFVINVADRKKAKAYGSLSKESEFIPYAVNSGNFWYVCDLPFDPYGTEYIFSDLLHDILQEKHQHYKYAMIRIEDIHPARSPRNLRRIGATFKKYDIPFCFGVIPLYTFPKTKKRVSLAEKPHLVSALRYLQSIGGTAILHGYTHQYKAESGEGHEFWDKDWDRPIPGETEDIIRKKLIDGIEACVSQDIYPLAWETPHYGASELDYRIFSEFFSTGVEQLQLSDLSFKASQSYPYFIESVNGRWIVPENLGYVSYREGATVERMLEEAKKLLIVRDAVAVGFFHPYVEIEHLEKLIQGLKDLGYTFLDLRDLPNQVKTDECMIFSGLPYFHKQGQIHKLFYNWDASSTRRIDFNNEYYYTFMLDRNFQKKNITVTGKPVYGEIVLQIPNNKRDVFVVHKGSKQSLGVKSVKDWLFRTLIGGQTVSFASTVMRLLMWLFFLVTAMLLIVLLVIYVGFWLFGGKR